MKLIKSISGLTIWKNKYLYITVLAVTILYPLRFTFTGLDLWDSGYNCLNYIYFGPEYMNPSLFYSTFLACVVGRVISVLPFGDTFAGIRLYCGLVISINVLLSSVFCIRKLKLNRWCVVFGELLAISLCYNPAVVLYNHLSFLLLTIVIILIYNGLVEDRNAYLAAAGFVLGLNIYVRFPNITQALLILAVWYYQWIRRDKVKWNLSKTFVCIAGWLASTVIIFIVINIAYGTGSYISGVKGLFGISEGAEDYSLFSMLSSMFGAYIRGFRRLVDVAVFTVIAYAAVIILRKIKGRDPEEKGKLKCAEQCVGVFSGIFLVIFFIVRRLMQFNFHHYETIVLTAALFTDVALIFGLMLVISRKASDREKLISVLLLLQVAAVSVGSNTGIAPVMNSMFLTAPFLFNYLGVFLSGYGTDKSISDHGFFIAAKSYIMTDILKELGKIVLIIALSAFYVQCILFGSGYVYEDAQNGIGGSSVVTGNSVLSGIRMNEDRAEWMQGLTDYVNEEGLKGRDVIAYGYAPGLIYYLSLKPVIGSWPDLDSYSASSMRDDMMDLEKLIDEEAAECPIMIFDHQNLKEQQEHNPEKWDILSGFIDKYSYSEAYSCGRFSVYRAAR